MGNTPQAATRRRVMVVTCAILTLVGLDLVVRDTDPVLDAYYSNEYGRKIRAIDSLTRRPEVLLLGSSRAAYALVPSEFRQVAGIRAFNFGIPGSKVLEWQIVAERWITQWKPRLVVLGINASEVRADYAPVSAARDLFGFDDLVSYVRSDGWSNKVVGNYIERAAGRSWRLFHRRFEFLSLLEERWGAAFPKHAQIAAERRVIASRLVPHDGFEHPWLHSRRMRPLDEQLRIAPDAVIVADTPRYAPDAPAVRRFKDLLHWFRCQKIDVIVAYLPNSPRTESRWQEVEPLAAAAIARCCREAGVPFVPADMAALPRTDADYFEETHMGLPLARRISRRIAEAMVQYGLARPASDAKLAGAGPEVEAAP